MASRRRLSGCGRSFSRQSRDAGAARVSYVATERAWLANRRSLLGPRERRLAEGEGFEPPVPFPVQWFSRPPPSTTRPSLRIEPPGRQRRSLRVAAGDAPRFHRKSSRDGCQTFITIV